MLIIPLAKKPTWATLPIATLALLVINLFVFFFLQGTDERIERRFRVAYAEAGLAKLEFPRYERWLEDKGNRPMLEFMQRASAAQKVAELSVYMQSDRAFQAQLAAVQRVALDDAAFASWQTSRQAVDAIWRDHFTSKYLHVPAKSGAITYLSHMFMHAGFGHLLGNMIMLLMVGVLVEQAVGGGPVLLFYVLGGLCSVLFDLPFRSDPWVGSLGASGAIAALMGAATVLYGLRKVRFFYHLVFYFDFIMLPAIVLLPVWLLNEVVQWALFHKSSNVGYLMHIGGLIAGALMGFAFKQTMSPETARAGSAGAGTSKQAQRLNALDEVSTAEVEQARLARAQGFMGQMNWDAALREYLALAQAVPNNQAYAQQAYKLARMKPAAATYHQAALQILERAQRPEWAQLAVHTTNDYWAQAKPAPQLSLAALVKLSRNLAKQGEWAAAEHPLSALLATPPERLGDVNLAESLLTMVVACQRAFQAAPSDTDSLARRRSAHYLRILDERFAHSAERKLAHQLQLQL